MEQHITELSQSKNCNRFSEDEAEYLTSQLSKYYTVTDNQCWEWHGYRQGGKSPALTVRYKGKRLNIMVKRFVYMQHNDNAQIGTQVQLHNTCGNPDCVNPTHLQRGIGIGSSKSEAMKLVLRAWYPLFLDNVPTQDIAKQLGVCHTTLKSYIDVFNRTPEDWIKLWNK